MLIKTDGPYPRRERDVGLEPKSHECNEPLI